MKKRKWLVVVNKMTYLDLLISFFGLIGLIYAIYSANFEFGFASLFFIIIGIYLFLRENSYSEWMNPDHPHKK